MDTIPLEHMPPTSFVMHGETCLYNGHKRWKTSFQLEVKLGAQRFPLRQMKLEKERPCSEVTIMIVMRC